MTTGPGLIMPTATATKNSRPLSQPVCCTSPFSRNGTMTRPLPKVRLPALRKKPSNLPRMSKLAAFVPMPSGTSAISAPGGGLRPRSNEPLNEITFNTSLLKELRSLAFLWEIIHYENLERERFRDVHVDAIHDEKTMLGLGVSSKLNAEWAFLTHLRDCGRKAAQDWLAQHYDDLGVRNTLDLSWIYDESLKPAHLPEGAARGAAIKEAAG